MEDNKKEVQSEIIIYQTEDGNTKIDVKFQNETVWLTQAQLCELYQTSKSNISEHIKHIFEEGELEEFGAVALRKMIQDIASLKHSSILYLVYVLLSATACYFIKRYISG